MDHKKIISDIKNLKKEHFISEVKTAFDVALFKKDVMSTVSTDPVKTQFGYYIIIIGAILGMVGMQIFGGWLRPSIVSGLISAVISAVVSVAGIYLASFVAKKFFKGAASHDQFFRVAAYGMILTWASIVPAVGMIAGLWSLALYFVILVTIHKLTTGGAIGTILVTAVIAWVVMSIVAFSGIAGMMGGRYGSASKGFNFNMGGKDGGSFNINIPNIK